MFTWKIRDWPFLSILCHRKYASLLCINLRVHLSSVVAKFICSSLIWVTELLLSESHGQGWFVSIVPVQMLWPCAPKGTAELNALLS